MNPPPKPTAPLLPKPARTPLFSLTAALLSLSFISALTYLLLPHPHSPSPSPSPALILISFDGFRFGYQFKSPPLTPALNRLISTSTSADLGLIPVFPSLTFPNHYSIATGLYPPHHGIVANSFLDPLTGGVFTTHNHNSSFWLGEPIWETAADQGFPAAVYFWAGGEVRKGSWKCRGDSFCPKYNKSVPFEERVDAVLSYFDLPREEVPVFTALYFSDPDAQGHVFGPDHPEITRAVVHLDRVLGRLIEGLEERGIFEEVSIILVGDHGMVGTCEEKYVYLEDLKPWVEIPSGWVQSQGPLLAIRPPAGISVAELAEKMNEGLSSGKIENGDKLRVYLKEDLPERLHYSASDRICPVVGLVEEGYSAVMSRNQGYKCGGDHGYDNELFSMRSIFVGHGPRFEKGRKIPSFENVEIYNLMTSILGLKGAPNNGSDSFAESVLLPRT